MADKLRKPVRLLGNNSAGLSIRFRSNTTSVSVRWESLGNHRMNHMADVGVKGVDLYTLEDGHWRFVNSGRPVDKKRKLGLFLICSLKNVSICSIYLYMMELFL